MPDGQQLSAMERFTTASNPASPKTSLEMDGILHPNSFYGGLKEDPKSTLWVDVLTMTFYDLKILF